MIILFNHEKINYKNYTYLLTIRLELTKGFLHKKVKLKYLLKNND